MSSVIEAVAAQYAHRFDATPLDALRNASKHADPAVARRAANMLALFHLPEDAMRVLRALLKHGVPPGMVPDWLAALPGSVALFERDLDPDALYELVRRRRCAGLPNPAEQLRPRVLEAIAAGDGTGARIVSELRDPSYVDALIDGLAARDAATFHRTGAWRAIMKALQLFGEPALTALRHRAQREDGRSSTACMLAELERQATRPPWASANAYADNLFVEGRLEDRAIATDTAFAQYATALAACSDDAYAAFQLAWIDRAFGTPITDLRVDWLGRLGVQGQLLEAVAERPSAILPGNRSLVGRGDRARPDAALAAQAEAAGVAGVAATYVADPRERERLRVAAAAHLQRVRAGCRV